MMDERDAQLAIKHNREGRGHKFIVPNIQLFQGEADLISITRSGYIHEYEIKRTLSDFRADFKNKPSKHDAIKSRDPKRYSPAYFWSAIDEEVIEKCEVPDYAGLIKIQNLHGHYFMRIIKEAPRLHREKANDKFLIMLGEKMYWRYWSMFHVMMNYKNNLDRARQEIKTLKGKLS